MNNVLFKTQSGFGCLYSIFQSVYEVVESRSFSEIRETICTFLEVISDRALLQL